MANSIFPQQGIPLNQVAYNLYLLNPAAIGLNDNTVANCHYKKNWLGFTDSPEATHLTVDGPLMKNKIGLGLSLMNERAGIFSGTNLSLSFRYKLKLTAEHGLLFGVSGGFQRQHSDFSRIKAASPEEFSLWPSQQAATVPDAAFGIVYHYKRLYFTLSANQVLNRNFIFREPVFNHEFRYKPVSCYIFSAQNTFTIRPGSLELMPHLTLRSLQGMPVQADLSLSFIYLQKFMICTGYRHSYAMYSGLGWNISGNLSLRYFYEYSHPLRSVSRGGHEIGLRFGIGAQASKSNHFDRRKDLDEIFEKIDQYDQQIKNLREKADTMDKNILQLREEVERLKNQQLSPEEIRQAIDNYFDSENSDDQVTGIRNRTSQSASVNAGKFRVIHQAEAETEYDTINSSYRVVYGVYQLMNYAKQFQKILMREAGIKTILVEIPDHPKKYLYVCDTESHSELKKALAKLQVVTSQFSEMKVEITKGKPWILQITKQ